MKVVAWHAHPALKAQAVERMKEHAEQDRLMQGTYLSLVSGGWAGCLHGCLVVEDVAATYGISVQALHSQLDFESGDWWAETEARYGIPAEVGYSLDDLYEGVKGMATGDVAVSLLQAIPVGADLDAVVEQLRPIAQGRAIRGTTPTLVREVCKVLASAPIACDPIDAPPTEPADGTMAYWPASDSGGSAVAFMRDDTAATQLGAPHLRWFCPNAGYGPVMWPRAVAVAAARHPLDQVQYLSRCLSGEAVETIGVHRVLPDGWCQTCGVLHSPQEIERARERAGGDHG